MVRFRVLQTTKQFDHKNPLSGHEWSTHEVVPNSFYVTGPFVLPPYQKFRSEAAARQHADLLEGMHRKFPFKPPGQ